MFELAVKSKFSSAHFLREYKGKCENLHGHNWKVKLIVRGHKLDNIGILLDFKEMKRILNDTLDLLDHKLINDLDYFVTDHNPSCENITFYLYKLLSERINNENVKVYKVIVWETDDASSTYSED